MPFRFHRGETLIPEHHRQARDFAQPLAERASLRGLRSFAAVQMQRQADDDLTNLLRSGELPKIACVLLLVAPTVSRKGKSNLGIRVADGQADTDTDIIDAEQAGTGGHK